MLKSVFKYTDESAIRQRAMPKERTSLTSGQIALIKTYASNGRTNDELAKRFNVSSSTISEALKGKD